MPKQPEPKEIAPTHSRKATALLGVGMINVQPKPPIKKRDLYAVEVKQSERCVIL